MSADGAFVARLRLYPIKSLDGQAVEAARVLASGALEHDRRWALFDDSGAVANAKRHVALQTIRTCVALPSGVATLRDGTGEARFDLATGGPAFAERIAGLLGVPLTLAEDRDTGFPDDPAAPGPTLVSTATLEAVGGWFGLALDDVRARFRANVEIGGVPAFWEDRLFGAGDETVGFAIGMVGFEGTNPCLRCAVPSRDPWNGAQDRTFAKRFSARREAGLPPWAARDRFAPFYRLAVNTRLAEGGAGGTIRVGDALTLGAPPAR